MAYHALNPFFSAGESRVLVYLYFVGLVLDIADIESLAGSDFQQGNRVFPAFVVDNAMLSFDKSFCRCQYFGDRDTVLFVWICGVLHFRILSSYVSR